MALNEILNTLSESFFSMGSNHKGFICKHCGMHSQPDMRILDMDINTKCNHCDELLITATERALFKHIIAGNEEFTQEECKILIKWTALSIINNISYKKE